MSCRFDKRRLVESRISTHHAFITTSRDDVNPLALRSYNVGFDLGELSSRVLCDVTAASEVGNRCWKLVKKQQKAAVGDITSERSFNQDTDLSNNIKMSFILNSYIMLFKIRSVEKFIILFINVCKYNRSLSQFSLF